MSTGDFMNQSKFNHIVNKFMQEKHKHIQLLNILTLLIKNKNQCYVHHYNNTDNSSDIRSISKTVLTLILGVVIRLTEEGAYPKISDETYIYPIIKNNIHLVNKSNEE